MFPSGSKPRGHRTAGLEALAAVAQAVQVPVLAIGGISLNTVAAAAEAGAAGVAAIGLFFDAAGPMDDLRGRLIQTVAGLRLAFDRQAPSRALARNPRPMAAMPLLECFIRGDVDPEVSLLAAQGALAPRADEQLAILVYLVTHDETHVATVANQTIASLPVEAVAGLLARQDTSAKVLAFFAARGILPGAVATEDTDAPLVDTGGRGRRPRPSRTSR